MKLKYRIKIAFLKWLDKMHDRRIERKDRRIIINSILFDKMKGKKIVRCCRIRKIEYYEYIFKKIGLNYTVTKDKKEGVDVRTYTIIYKAIEDVQAAMVGMLDPEYEEKVIGSAEVRQLFKFSKVGTIAGSYVTSGVIKRDSKARIIRDGVVIYDGNINSVAREKDQVKEVKAGLECGITIENFNDLKENDIIETYDIVEIKR